MLSSIPVKDPQQLVFVRTNRIKVGNFEVSTTILNRDVDEMRRRAAQVDGIASSQKESRLNVAVDGRAELVSGDFVSGNYFQLLGVPAQIGRTIVFADDAPKAAYMRMLEELKSLPSVRSVSLMNNRLLSGRAHFSDAKVPGYVPRPGEDLANSWTLEYDVGPRYCETMRMPLVAGRDFTERDDESAPVAIIVNEAFANTSSGERILSGKESS